MVKLLFILKRKENFNELTDTHIGLSTGLYNSASFMNDFMVEEGFESNLVVVIDNNDIDREVTRYKPDIVIIEALWVVPTKFDILQKLHPKVKWIIRLHSELPFIANEGMAMDWLGDYSKFRNIIIACNAPRMLDELRTFLRIKNQWKKVEDIIYLPNYYPVTFKEKPYDKDKEIINISCFGAIRPLKNHLVQAIAALKFVEKTQKKLRFHINMDRIEMKGEPVMNNLRGFFQHLYPIGHEMVGHRWTPREGFLKICSEMDIGLQCTFSETFNIVAADLICEGVPVVTSGEIPWSYHKYDANPVSSDDIYNKLLLIHENPIENVIYNQRELYKYGKNSRDIWVKYFTDFKG